MRPLAVLALTIGPCLLGSGCDRPNASPAIVAEAPPPEHAPDVTWQQNGQDVSLAALEGQTVLLHFADAASPSWRALEEAYPDLYAEGTTILGIVTEGTPSRDAPFEITTSNELAQAFNVTLTPTAIMVDAEGWVRGRAHALDADAFFALAAPVLLDESVNTPVSVPNRQLDADGLLHLARAGAVLIDLRTDAVRESDGWVPLALPSPFDTFTAKVLPADLSATLIFLGPDADAASELAMEWGYVSVLGLVDAAPYVEADATPNELDRQFVAPPLSPSRTVKG